ncbi:MAG: M15 family metallopeptidase [bacterium]|nr:M15 family metallopeptidase [bacterium]
MRAHLRCAVAALVGLVATAALAQTPPCTADARVAQGDADARPERVLLDPAWRLPIGYAPTDLVPVAAAGFAEELLVRALLLDDLRALRTAAEADGVQLAVQSAYRSEAYQERVHAGWVRQLGAARAADVSARPSHSEHQLGTAIDLRSAGGPPPWDLEDWSTTPEGAWIAEHAHRFGFVISYPRDARDVTCYAFEPWHLRWVGRDTAALVRASGLAYRAWLYLNDPPSEAP